MAVNLPVDIEANSRAKVESGRFADETDVIRAAINRLDQQERLRWLKNALAEGERGDPIDFTDDLMDELAAEAEVNSGHGKPISDAVKP